MIEMDVFVIDLPSQQRALIGTCTAPSASSADVRAAARERILYGFRNHRGVYYTPPILLEEKSSLLKYGVVWKERDTEAVQYDLYVVEVVTEDLPVTDAIDLPYRNNTMVGTLLNMMEPSFRQQRASKRVRAILRGDE